MRHQAALGSWREEGAPFRMAKKTRKSQSGQAQKSGLKKLREKGLYKPKKPRAAPTKYGKSLLSRFADVLSGKASVVTAVEKGRKGFKAASKYARSGNDKMGTVRVVRNKIVVPTQAGEIARFSKKGVRVTRRVGEDVYVREPLQKHKQILEQLKPGDRIAVPLNRGKRGVEWMQLTPEDYRAFQRQYDETYKNLGSHVQIFRLEKAKRRSRLI